MRQLSLGLLSLALSAIPIIGHSASIGVLEMLLLAIAALNIAVLFSRKENPYSVQKVINLFSLFFYAIAPAVQYHQKVRMLGTYFSQQDYIFTAFVVLCVILLFNGSYYYLWRKERNRRFELSYSDIPKRPSFITGCWAIGMAVAVFAAILWQNGGSILSMLFRGGEFHEGRELESYSNTLISSFIRPMGVIIFLFYYIKPQKSKLVTAVLAVFMLLTCSPMGMARLAVFALYLPVVFLVFPIMRRHNVFTFATVVAVLVIFPFLNTFRYFTSDTQIELAINFDQFEDLNFDAFSMFMRAITSGVITWGRQLLGVLFFFVPRAVWPTKPVGSGHFFAEIQDLSFDNISMPYFAEGYVNFGFAGVLLFTLIIAWIAARMDFWYWKSDVSRGVENMHTMQYYIFLGMIFFMMRGDLLSSFAYTVGMMVSCWTVRKVMG